MKYHRLNRIILPLLFLPWILAGSAPAATNFTVVGWNNLGMHCMDSDYSVFSILPPYNTIHAQLIQGVNGTATVISAGMAISYQAVADPSGSINRTSVGKGNFYQYVRKIFGLDLAVDVGLPVPGPDSWRMPGITNPGQSMAFETNQNWFAAYGIPIFPTDDAGRPNQYPMMRLVASNSLNQILATTDIVLPVSDEMNCRLCHSSGSSPAAQPAAGWIHAPNPGRDYRLNILRLHDERQWTNHAALYSAALASNGFHAAGLYATVVINKNPFLCASCHVSEALPLPPLLGIPPLTTVVHGHHADVTDPRNGLTLEASNNRLSCYTCHPGSVTRCLRGAMGKAVNPADGTMAMQCQSCHGPMSAVGNPGRTGWLEEPSCEACHTGDAVSNSGQIRFTNAITNGLWRVPGNRRFATDSFLYRFSTGHGGVKCSGCHGSTHAEFPSAVANDNVTGNSHQGHAGVLVECTVCHAGTPAFSNSKPGPHGMHPVGGTWNTGHGGASGERGTTCKPCHGPTLTGTVLSRVQGNRPGFTHSFDTGTRTRTFWRGSQVGCFDCHNGPADHDTATLRAAPTVSSTEVTTYSGVTVTLTPSIDAGTLRIVSQPANGTVAVSNNLQAVYFPARGFAGTEIFTYAANDGWRDSDLATGTVHVIMTYSLGDSLPDWWRQENFDCLSCPKASLSGDPDGDGMSNEREYVSGTDPNDERSFLHVFNFGVTNGTVLLDFDSMLGTRYGIEARDDLTTGGWSLLNSNLWGRTDATSFSETNTLGHSRRFYRVRVLP